MGLSCSRTVVFESRGDSRGRMVRDSSSEIKAQLCGFNTGNQGFYSELSWKKNRSTGAGDTMCTYASDLLKGCRELGAGARNAAAIAIVTYDSNLARISRKVSISQKCRDWAPLSKASINTKALRFQPLAPAWFTWTGLSC